MNKALVSIYKNKWLNLSIMWFIFGAFLIYVIPPRRGDPLHYLSMAWEMYRNHLYLSTYMGGRLDLEKTPLFYWPIVGGWHIFGVNNIWPFIYTYIIGWSNLMLTAWLAKQLFSNIRIAWISVFILITSLYWPLFFQDIRFEGLLVLFGMLFLNLVIKAATSGVFYWILAAISFGFCTFSKGPVSFIYYLPFVVSLPFFVEIKNLKMWYLKLTVAILSGLIIPLLWLFIVYIQHGMPAINYLLFGQVTQRVGIVYKFLFSPLIRGFINMLPWTLIYIFYLVWHREKLTKNILIWWVILLIQFLFFGVFVERQALHYLIPLFPIIAILMAPVLNKFMSDKQFWWIGGLFLLALAAYQITLRTTKYKTLEPIAKQLSLIQQSGAPIAQFGIKPGYQNFQFLGRLKYDIPILVDENIQTEWIKTHSTGWIIETYGVLPKNCHFSQQWRIADKWIVVLLPVKDYLAC